MIYFTCPHCDHPYHETELLEQEHVLIDDPTPLGEKNFRLICQNCLDAFCVTRQTRVIFSVVGSIEPIGIVK